MGIDPNISAGENGQTLIKAEQSFDSTITNDDMENGGDDCYLALSTPDSDKCTRSEPTESNWESFLSSNNVNTTS